MSSANTAIPISQARALVRDLFTPKPWIYWLDLVVTLSVAYTAAGIYLLAPLFSLEQIVCYFVAGVALFRAALFMHEVVHFRKGEMVPFKVFWNVMAGIPMLMPSFLYESHLAHHNTHHYGTGNDGEYLPLGVGGLRNIGRFLTQILGLPIFVGLRFFLGTPLSFLHPQLREWTLERASSFVINFSYRRALPDNAPRRVWAWMELACFLRACLIFIVPLLPQFPLIRVVQIYSLALLALGLNHIRTLVAHRYLSTGSKMSFLEQFGDSVNVTGTPFVTELLFPVGLRYHALHHLFPSIPYHNLGIAHRRLVANLPADSVYHMANHSGFWSALRELLRNSRQAMQNPPPGADAWYRRRQEELVAVAPELDGNDSAQAELPPPAKCEPFPVD